MSMFPRIGIIVYVFRTRRTDRQTNPLHRLVVPYQLIYNKHIKYNKYPLNLPTNKIK